MGIWWCAKFKTIGSPRAKTLPDIWHCFNIYSLLRLCQTTSEVFNWHKIRGFNSSPRNYKRSSALFYPYSYVFLCFKVAQVYLRSTSSRVYNGHLQNEWVIKPFRKHPQSSKFVFTSPVFSAGIIYTLFIEIPRYPEIPRIEICETSHSRRHLSKGYIV